MKKLKYLVFATIFTMMLSVPIVSTFAAQPDNISNYARIELTQSEIMQHIQSVNNVNSIVVNYGRPGEEVGTLTITGSGMYSDDHDTIYVPNNTSVTLTGAGINAGYTAKIIKNNVSESSPVEISNITGTTNIDVEFLINAYLVWSCDNKICYKLINDLSNNAKFIAASTIEASNVAGKHFDVNANEKFFAPYDKFQTKKAQIDANSIDIEDLIGPDGIDYQPVGEPVSNNAYTSYGDRSFKVTIYGSKYRGVTLGSLSDLTYYPSTWTDPLVRIESYDISGTSKENPTNIETILLEPIINIKSLAYNSFEIASIEALDVPTGAVTITKDGDDYKFSFSSNFYDNVVFKVTDTANNSYYFRINRKVLFVQKEIVMYPSNIGNLDVFTDFYFNRAKSYSDYVLKAIIEYKDGTTKLVNMTNAGLVEDKLGNPIGEYEADDADEQSHVGPSIGKGLKISTYKYTFKNGEVKKVSKMYITVENAGTNNVASYSGAFSGSGKGVVITFKEVQ